MGDMQVWVTEFTAKLQELRNHANVSKVVDNRSICQTWEQCHHRMFFHAFVVVLAFPLSSSHTLVRHIMIDEDHKHMECHNCDWHLVLRNYCSVFRVCFADTSSESTHSLTLYPLVFHITCLPMCLHNMVVMMITGSPFSSWRSSGCRVNNSSK